MSGLYDNYQTNQRDNLAECLDYEIDYRMQYYDVVTNPRWPTTANIKIVMSSYVCEKNEPIMMKFGMLDHIVTLIKIMK